MNKLLAFALLMTVVLLASGCAYLANNAMQTVTISTTPDQATVRIDNQEYQTPATIKLSRNGKYFVEITKQNYDKQTMNITRKLNSWGWVDIVCTLFLVYPLISLVIDWGTGAWYDLTPSSINIELKAAGATEEFGYNAIGPDNQLYHVALCKAGK